MNWNWCESDDNGLSERQERRLVELAQRKAADDPALACAAWRAVQLEDAPTPPGGGRAFIASYGGRSVVVAVEADALEDDGEE